MERSNELKGEVLHIVSDERAINYLWEEAAKNISPEVQILPISTAEREKDIFEGGKVLLNSIWIKHPFIPNKYIEIDRAEDDILKMKLDAIGNIARLLGAREYETSYVTEVFQKRERVGGGGCRYKTFETNTSVTIDKSNEKTAKYHRHERYSGKFTEKSYLLAKKKAKEYGLDKDNDICYLIETRNPKDSNKLMERMVATKITEDLNKSIDIAFSLGVGIFNIKASYNETLEKRKSVEITSRLVF